MKLVVFCFFLAAGFASTEAVLDWFKWTFGSCRNDRVKNAPARARDPLCEAKADRGECAFYDCFEERYPCGTCGYAKDYGVYSCEKFMLPKYYDSFDFAGKQWIKSTGRCLTKKLKSLYLRDRLSCRVTKKVMIRAIPNCYIDNGFCNMSAKNALVFNRVFTVDRIQQSLRRRTTDKETETN